MLKVSGLETFYGASQALFGMALEVNTGEVVTLIGRNGMGKTTIVHSIMGITPPRAGEITFEGQNLFGEASYTVAQAGLGLVPEGRQVFPNLTVTENLVATSANRSGRESPWTLDAIFDFFPPLASRKDGMANLLSGGEQQMLAIGRALMTNPKLLILDEATEGLAPLIRTDIWNVLERLKQAGQAILVIDKNIADLARIADRHYIVEKGAAVWSGSSEDLLDDATLTERYLGV